MEALVGYTGFVGSNIYDKGNFDAVYNSRNIEDAYGSKPQLLIYAGLRAEKYLANHDPGKDMEMIEQAEKNIEEISPEKLVLISTIDVLKDPRGQDENSQVDLENLQAYGYNRYQLEKWVREHYPNSLIVRLPALFGKNIKKNFIYDFINIIPFMLTVDKMRELQVSDNKIIENYELKDNGFYKLKNLSKEEKERLREKFKKVGFSALNFTDSRSIFQFYNLENLWRDIKIALDADLKLLHLATEPISIGELYIYLTGKEFDNELKGTPIVHGYKTIHYHLYGGKNGFICDKNSIMKDIKNFVLEK